MAAAGFPKFGGSSAENHEKWLADFNSFCAYKKIADADKVPLLPLVLTTTARLWWDSLPPPQNPPRTFADFVTAFNDRFKRNDFNIWSDISQLYDLKQGVTQKVEDFLYDVEQRARRANVPPDQIRYAALRGFLPHIRASVVASKSTDTLEEIRRWAIAAETAGPHGPVAPDDMAHTVARLEAQLSTYCKKVDNMPTVRELQPTQQAQPAAAEAAPPQPTHVGLSPRQLHPTNRPFFKKQNFQSGQNSRNGAPRYQSAPYQTVRPT